MKKTATPSTAVPAPVGPPKPIAVPALAPKPVAVPGTGVSHKQVTTSTAGGGIGAGNKIPIIETTPLIRSRSSPSVASIRSGQSNNPSASGQTQQRSKSQTIERTPSKAGSVTSKPPVGYTYSAGPGFKARRTMAGHEGLWAGELPPHFAQWEIRRLGKRFRKLDMDNSGSLSVEEFMSLPELQQNPCVQRVLDIFDVDGNGEIDFKEFIHGISQFSVKGDKTSKLKFAFRLYDIDKDGYISNGELFQVLKMMVGNNLKDARLQQIVDKTIIYADKDRDGKISFSEFCAVVGTSTDVHKKMIVEV